MSEQRKCMWCGKAPMLWHECELVSGPLCAAHFEKHNAEGGRNGSH